MKRSLLVAAFAVATVVLTGGPALYAQGIPPVVQPPPQPQLPPSPGSGFCPGVCKPIDPTCTGPGCAMDCTPRPC
jgi:hypothetical protein